MKKCNKDGGLATNFNFTCDATANTCYCASGNYININLDGRCVACNACRSASGADGGLNERVKTECQGGALSVATQNRVCEPCGTSALVVGASKDMCACIADHVSDAHSDCAKCSSSLCAEGYAGKCNDCRACSGTDCGTAGGQDGSWHAVAKRCSRRCGLPHVPSASI